MARTATQPSTVAIKDGIGDLKMQFDMEIAPVDPENIVSSDAHVRMPLHWTNGNVGTSPWHRVVDLPSLSAQDKTDLRRIIKLIRDDIHTAAGATGTPDDA